MVFKFFDIKRDFNCEINVFVPWTDKHNRIHIKFRDIKNRHSKRIIKNFIKFLCNFIEKHWKMDFQSYGVFSCFCYFLVTLVFINSIITKPTKRFDSKQSAKIYSYSLVKILVAEKQQKFSLKVWWNNIFLFIY